MMTDRLISEQAVMESLTKEYNQKRTGDGLKLAWIEKAVSATPTASDWSRYSTKLWKEAYERGKRDAQPEVAKDTNVPNTDCISRQEAIDAADKIIERDTSGNNDVVKAMTAWKEYVKYMPAAQPEKETPKRVLWTGWKGYRDTRYKCPNCKKPVKNDDVYCHRCGQKLMFPHVDWTPYVEGQKQELIVRWDDE